MATWGSPPGSGDVADAEPLAAPPARLRPGRVWYLVALAVIVAGVAWLLVGLAAFNGQIDSFQRVALPGNGEITLTHGGGYVIYYEGRGAAAGNAPVLTVRLRPLSASAAVQSITPAGSFSFSFGSHADTAVLNLQIAHPGRFLLQARAPAAPAGSRLAVGSGVGGSLARVIVPFIALIVVGVCGVVAVAFIRGSRRSRERRLALAGFASQYGMQYSEDDPYNLPAHDFGLLRAGNRRGRSGGHDPSVRLSRLTLEATAAVPRSRWSVLGRVRDSMGPVNQCPAGHLIMALSTGPSADCMMNRQLTSAGSPHRAAPPGSG